MISININHETDTAEEMVEVLQMIGLQIQAGNTSGYYPSWELSGEETETEE